MTLKMNQDDCDIYPALTIKIRKEIICQKMSLKWLLNPSIHPGVIVIKLGMSCRARHLFFEKLLVA